MEEITRDSYIFKSGMTVRATNVLLAHSDFFGVPYTPGQPFQLKFKDLEGFSKLTLSTFRNAGKLTVAEIEEFCQKAGVKLDP